ncbi:hypothetical protein ACFL35_18575 [Candidatus Riflebacteria bacterium]
MKFRFFIILNLVFLSNCYAFNPYFKREIKFKELWKFYRFAYKQRNYKRLFDRYFKGRSFHGRGKILAIRHPSHEKKIISIHLRHIRAAYSIILWLPYDYDKLLYRSLLKLKEGEIIDFTGELIGTYKSAHLRIVFLPQMVRYPGFFKPEKFIPEYEGY